MRGRVVCRIPRDRCILRFVALRSWPARLKGLLGTSKAAEPVALCGCSSIHTHGMRYAIDVAFVAQNGSVIASRRRMPPGKRMSADGARYVLERPSSDAPWPAGDSWVGIVEYERW